MTDLVERDIISPSDLGIPERQDRIFERRSAPRTTVIPGSEDVVSPEDLGMLDRPLPRASETQFAVHA